MLTCASKIAVKKKKEKWGGSEKVKEEIVGVVGAS